MQQKRDSRWCRPRPDNWCDPSSLPPPLRAGRVYDAAGVGSLCRAAGVLYMLDACQVSLPSLAHGQQLWGSQAGVRRCHREADTALAASTVNLLAQPPRNPHVPLSASLCAERGANAAGCAGDWVRLPLRNRYCRRLPCAWPAGVGLAGWRDHREAVLLWRPALCTFSRPPPRNPHVPGLFATGRKYLRAPRGCGLLFCRR